MTRAPRANTRLGELPRYLPGRTSEAAMAEHGLASAVKLASNESPFGPLPGVPEAVAAAVTGLNRYADHTAGAVRERFADQVGARPANVAVGPGSVGLLEQLALAFVEPGETVVYPWPSFIAYPQFTRLVAGTERTTPLVRHTFDVDALVAAIDERTRLVLVANPNNPTSTALRRDDLTQVVDAAGPDCLVVIDEAYHEFATGADVPDAIECFGNRPNVAVLRTLSKAYGLAGLRIGFLVADPTVIDAVDACAIPFGVNAVAQAAALAALDEEQEVIRRAGIVTAERSRVAQQLRHLGLGVADSQANFWWLPAGAGSARLAAELERRGVVTRPLGTGVRVTVGSPDENTRFLAALGGVLSGADVDVTAEWAGATGATAGQAAGWLERLDAVMARLRTHLDRPHPGRTEPVSGEDETWEAGQVWAHLAEFGDYWLEQLAIVLDATSPSPVPFGRTRRDAVRIDAIERGRRLDPAAHLDTVERSADRLQARLAGMDDEDWARTGRHETLGTMDLDRQLGHFHVGHYEEHADQLDGIT